MGIRPQFSQTLDLEPDAVQVGIERILQAANAPCEVKSFPGYICLRIPEEERHFWSPRLTLSIDPEEDGKTRLVGIYGPNANVWGLFFYGYLFTGSAALFSGILGLVQFSLDRTAWGLWIFGLVVAAMIGLFVLARFGQKLGAPQTSQLHEIYQSTIGDKVEID